ncbi:MAG TPA: glycosyltransferase [Rhizomicrobium sp.]|nr:glycosyltransferase [Rhizomicrobium sp.]
MEGSEDIEAGSLASTRLGRGARAVSAHARLSLRRVDLERDPPDPSLLRAAELDAYCTGLFVPWRREKGRLVIACAEPTPAQLAYLRGRNTEPVLFAYARRDALLGAVETQYRDRLTHDAVHGLAEAEPQLSANRTFTGAQARVIAGAVFLAAAAILVTPRGVLAIVAGLLAAAYLANILFRIALVWLGAAEAFDAPPAPAPVASEDLPLYTILVPLYDEANVVPSLIASLRALDYPREKLDIKLVVEADDGETRKALRTLDLDPCFHTVVVPSSSPRTKPKACNYALRFARGEFVVIFDAEDRPERDQLKKAVASFRAGPANVSCLQARLNFYNRDENWLTRLFTLDYALWFDFLLPGLDALRVPMPLGGTSNHFRTAVLRSIHGWDSFNVTEDADLGVRLARLGHRATTLDSTTYEEATSRLDDWMKQRSRWLKGYMQTWLVHMRNPLALWRHAGPRGFFAFQLFIGGTFVSSLANPLMWAIFLISHATGIVIFSGPLGEALARASLFSLVAGNALFVYLAMLGPYRRGWLKLAPYGLTAPVYWLLISAAAWRALWQLLRRPFHWEKTRHGISAFEAISP